jgi:hypothetical protein
MILEMPVGERVERIRNLWRGMAGLCDEPLDGPLRRRHILQIARLHLREQHVAGDIGRKFRQLLLNLVDGLAILPLLLLRQRDGVERLRRRRFIAAGEDAPNDSADRPHNRRQPHDSEDDPDDRACKHAKDFLQRAGTRANQPSQKEITAAHDDQRDQPTKQERGWIETVLEQPPENPRHTGNAADQDEESPGHAQGQFHEVSPSSG